MKHFFSCLCYLSSMYVLFILWVVQVRDMPDGSARWIAKPSITNQATGICIFDRVSQLEAALHANEDLREWVLQRWELPENPWPRLASFGLIRPRLVLFGTVWPYLASFGLMWSHVAYPDLICQLPSNQEHNSFKHQMQLHIVNITNPHCYSTVTRLCLHRRQTVTAFIPFFT